MPSGIDHLVIAVPDLEAAAAEVTEKVGLAFTAGGRHAGRGTLNRIAFLGDAYLELMAVDDRAAAQGWAIGAAAVRALEGGGGFATWALADPAIRATVARLQANGSHIGPVTYGSRQRSDGEVAEWWTAAPPELGPDRPPFLIKHAAFGAEWGGEALAARRAFVHPIGSPVRLIGIEVAVADPVGLATRCFAVLDMEFHALGGTMAAVVGRHVVRLVPRGAGGTVTLTLAAGVGPPRSVSALGIGLRLTPTSAGLNEGPVARVET